VVLALCVIAVAAATLLPIAFVARPKERSEHSTRMSDESPYYDEGPAVARAAAAFADDVPEHCPAAHVRGAVDLDTGHTAFEITGFTTPEQDEAIATIVDTARAARRTRRPHRTVLPHGSISSAS
jgi:hypothetical protein